MSDIIFQTCGGCGAAFESDDEAVYCESCQYQHEANLTHFSEGVQGE